MQFPDPVSIFSSDDCLSVRTLLTVLEPAFPRPVALAVTDVATVAGRSTSLAFAVLALAFTLRLASFALLAFAFALAFWCTAEGVDVSGVLPGVALLVVLIGVEVALVGRAFIDGSMAGEFGA